MRPIYVLAGIGVFVGSLSAELSVENIEKMVEEIRAQRTSKMIREINITSPFVAVQQEQNATQKVLAPAAEKREPFLLGAIVNDRAFINGNWHREGDEIDGFVLKAIEPDHVTLSQEDRTVVVFFKKAKSILTFSKE
jgi:2-phospho-L-lactate transferase/gluconeogenesis factor (CofD/UPF0052 family)